MHRLQYLSARLAHEARAEYGIDQYLVVAADTVSSRSEENRHIGIEAMRQEGVKILSTEAILFALMKGADHLKFRDIAKLVK